MSSPTTSNAAIGLSDAAIKTIMDAVATAVEAYLKAQLPILAAPIISGLVDLAVGYLESLEITQLEQIATFAIVDVQTTTEQSNFASAASVLAAAQATGSPDAISQATQNFKTALGALIHFDGS